MTNDKTNDKTNDELDVQVPTGPVQGADDPRLTAYALGELDATDAGHREVEAFLADSSEGRALVEETRALAGVLQGELASELESGESPHLDPSQRDALEKALVGSPAAAGGGGSILRLWMPTAAAAALVLVIVWQVTREPGPGGLPPHASIAMGEAPIDHDGDLVLDSAAGERVSFGKRAQDLSANHRSKGAPRKDDQGRTLQSLGYAGKPEAELSREAPPQSAARPVRNEGAMSDSLASGDTGASELQGDDSSSDIPEGRLDQLRQLGYLDEQGGGEAQEKPSAAMTGRGRTAARRGEARAGGRTGDGEAPIQDRPYLLGVGVEPGQASEPDRAAELQALVATAPEVALEDGVQDRNYAVKVANGPAGPAGPMTPAKPTATPAPATTAPADPATTRWLREMGYVETDAGDDARRRLYDRDRLIVKRELSGESYAPIHENDFKPLTSDPYTALSTFGVDVDTASYANMRRFLNRNQAPPPDSVRLEELINYFDYALPEPAGEHPFSVTVESATAPWASRHQLVRIGLQGTRLFTEERPPSNLVFLLDVSGSMKNPDKLPLLISSLKMLVRELDANDRVAIVTYASGTRVALPSTSGADSSTILSALDLLTAGGSTHASAGIQQAYQVAAEHFIEGGVNRVLLATDGDFNVGITEEGQLESFITEKAKGGVFLTVLGFGTGNLQDSKAEVLADRGNGNYAYIDSLNEAHKVLVKEMGGTLVTIAKDVKLQVEFNPGRVAAYRLLGYENRALAAQDFRDDTKDAGEIGAGHSVTALYEVVPTGLPPMPGAVTLKYQTPPPAAGRVLDSPELLTVNLRYKLPAEDTGREFALPLMDGERAFSEASDDFRFAASVASFGMVLRHSQYAGDTSLQRIYEWASAARGPDEDGLRAEFLRLVRTAQGIPGY